MRSHLWLIVAGLLTARCISAPEKKAEHGSPECEKLKKTMCPMNYMPATCTVNTIHGGKIKIEPLKALGGNTCQAMLSIQQQACDKGIATPDKFLKGDIKCELSDPK